MEKEHDAELPNESVAVQTTTFVPSGKNDPLGGVQETELTLPQWLMAVGAG